MDMDGITDIPMRLLIAAVLTSLAVPMVLDAYEDLSCSVANDRALREMDAIADAARAVLDGDVGSSMDIGLELRGWGSATLTSVVIGGAIDPARTSEAYMMVFQIELLGRVSSAPDPPIAMTNADGSGGMVLGEGRTHLTVTHIVIGSVHAASFSRD